ncbi:MAG: tripartite tricarboxylate transporter substrate binding protein [Syntrophales bacterium LBB04]|nr:tripartite tricarboxylate transporter substrate binding protein [Syntrophales bacterium LBB04]
MIKRRYLECVCFAVVCMLSFASAGSLWGQQAYPTKPIDLLIGYAPGASGDLTERLLAGKAEKMLGQPFISTNNGGSSGAVAVTLTLKKPPDGYNLLGSSSTALVRAPLFNTVPYKWDDVTPIMHFAAPILTSLVVRSDSPWKSLKEIVDYAKKNPGKVSYSTLGVGSPMHMAMEFIAKQEGGIKWTHVPYQGTMPAFMALLGGHVAVQLGSGECIPYVKDGTLRLLANVGERRVKSFPDVPTLKELGYDYFNETVFLFAAPKATPQAIIDKLDKTFHQAMSDPDFINLLGKLEFEPSYRNSADTMKYLRDADRRLTKMVQELKIQKGPEEKK